MKNKTFPLFIIAMAIMVSLPSCAKYRPAPLPNRIDGSTKKVAGVEVSTRAFNEADCRVVFSRKVISNGYQPVQISIRNESDKTFVLNPTDINASLEPVNQVARKLHLNTAGRVIGWSIGGLFFWPLFIPAAYEGIKCEQANKDLDIDLASRAIDPQQPLVIHPGQIVNKVMFVHTDNYQPHLNIKLTEREKGEKLTFKL